MVRCSKTRMLLFVSYQNWLTKNDRRAVNTALQKVLIRLEAAVTAKAKEKKNPDNAFTAVTITIAG